MAYNFDQYIERRNTDSYKWGDYGDDVLPLWVADMDFAAPEPVLRALHCTGLSDAAPGIGGKKRLTREKKFGVIDDVSLFRQVLVRITIPVGLCVST